MKEPYIIGITGGSGSGKTSFIKAIRAAFSTEELCVVSQDDYYFPREKQEQDAEGIHNFDLPTSIDLPAFIADVKSLIAGKVVERQEYTFNNKNAVPKLLHFYPAPVIIVEGLFIFHSQEMKDLMHLKVFFHAKENLKVIRRIKRDKIERNYPLDDVLYRYQKHVLPAFEQYIEPYREEADLVINNNAHFNNGLDVLKGFIQSKQA